MPGSTGIEPSNAPVVGSKAFIYLSTKLKLPTSRSPPNWPKAAGARVMPQGAASWLPLLSVCSNVPFSSRTPPRLPFPRWLLFGLQDH